MNEVVKYLMDNWPAAIWILVGGSIVWLFLSVKTLSKTAKERAEEAHIKIVDLPCPDHKKCIDSQKDDHRDLDLKLEKYVVNLGSMSKDIQNIIRILNKEAIELSYTQKMSPLTLTDKGKKFVDRMDVNKMINDKWSDISELITKTSESKNPYDVDQACIDQTMLYPEKFLTSEEIDAFKLEAYKEGDMLQSIMKIIAVLIRDRYFKEHDISLDSTE